MFSLVALFTVGGAAHSKLMQCCAYFAIVRFDSLIFLKRRNLSKRGVALPPSPYARRELGWGLSDLGGQTIDCTDGFVVNGLVYPCAKHLR